MDDTTWIANSKEELQQITNTAEEFYTINDIQTNPTKSFLLIINGNQRDRTGGITLRGQHITGTDPLIPIRILGIWHSATGSKQHQKLLIKQKIEKTCKLIGMKYITDKQSRYIINHVLMPSIEYLLNDMCLPENICNAYMSKISKIFKHKIGLTSTVPNTMIYNKLEYNIFHLYERQIQLHASNWIQRINKNNISGTIARYRLQDLQNRAWTTKNILYDFQHKLYKPGTNLTHDILKMLRKNGISFLMSDIHKPFTTIEQIDITIQEIMGEQWFNKHHYHLQKYNLIFIGQLLNENRSKILAWCQQIKPGKHGKRGIQPK